MVNYRSNCSNKPYDSHDTIKNGNGDAQWVSHWSRSEF